MYILRLLSRERNEPNKLIYPQLSRLIAQLAKKSWAWAPPELFPFLNLQGYVKLKNRKSFDARPSCQRIVSFDPFTPKIWILILLTGCHTFLYISYVNLMVYLDKITQVINLFILVTSQNELRLWGENLYQSLFRVKGLRYLFRKNDSSWNFRPT